MISEIKNIMSSDIFDFKTYWPEDERSFMFSITVTVGIKGKPGGDLFGVEICTPKWLLDNYNENEIILGVDKLIVFKYDIEKILSRIRALFDGCSGNTWEEIAIKLSRIGHWEFENYQEKNS